MLAGGPAGVRRGRVDLDRLRSPAVLYVHLSQSTSHRGTHGVARVEGVGPVTVEQAREFLTHTRVKIVPVLDPTQHAAVNSYEIPPTMAEAIRLRNPASAYPWSGSTSRHGDLDHTTPYRPPDQGGPPGQTSLGNLSRLTRREHRIKTFAAGWRMHQPLPGIYYWRTRHGYWTRVDPTGTTGTSAPTSPSPTNSSSPATPQPSTPVRNRCPSPDAPGRGQQRAMTEVRGL